MPIDKPRILGVCHVGMKSNDPAALGEFYQDILGMQVVGSSDASSPVGASTFLSSRPEEESHEIVFFTNSDFAHTAFKVASIADLRDFHAGVVQRGIDVRMAVNHGVSIAFYFHDPDGNMIEMYWPTGLKYGQPYGHPIDLTLDDGAIFDDVAKLAEREGVAWSRPSQAKPLQALRQS